MDPPDSTELNLNLCDLNDSEVFGPEPNMQHDYNDDIFQDLFALSNELKESVLADQLENDCLQYDHKMKSSPDNPDSEEDLKSASNINGKDPDFQVSTMIEKLKQQNKELKEKSLKQECELVQYEEKLSEKMNDLLKVQMERDSLKESLRLADDERAYLKLKVEEKEAELIQFKSLIKEQLAEEDDIEALKKQLLNETKLLKKTERDLQRNTDLLSKSKERLQLLRKRNKKLASTVLAFGELLERKELLSVKRKKYLELVKKESRVDEENSIDDNSSEDEMVGVSSLDEANSLKGNHMSVSNGLLIKEETSSHSNVLPVDSNTNSVVSSPVKNVISPISPIMCKTEETSNYTSANVIPPHKTNNLSPDSNFQSFASGTESLCSEDDITDECFAKIKEGIEGWVLKSENYAPLSPLPPTPPPSSSLERRFSRSEYITKTDNSDKLTPFSSVSTSLETLSECSEKIVSDKSSSLLEGESDRTESSDMPIPFSIVPCFDQQITPSTKVSYEYLKKKNVLSSQNFSTSETESGVTESTTKVAQNFKSSLNQQVTPLSPESSEYTEKENVLSLQTSSNSDSENIKNSDHFIPFTKSTNQNTIPASPESSSACIQKENALSPQTSSNSDSDHLIPFTNATNQNTIPASPESSFICVQKKNILSHQNSKGFEPHIEENSERSVLNNSTVSESFVSPLVIPPELHYLSSYNENNSFKIVHQGNSVYDYLVNPETKLSVCILTLSPKMASLGSEIASLPNSAVKNANMLPHKEERMKRVLSLYQATEKRVTLVKNQIIGTDSSGYPNNTPIENLPHVCVVVESENDVSVNTVGNNCLPENASDSGMDLDDASVDDMQKDNTEGVKGQADENQYLVSSSCDVSTSSKRKMTSSSFKHHSNIQSQLTNKKHCTKSHDSPMELHQKDEIVPNVSETISRKKRPTENNDDVSSKKIKAQLLNDMEKKEIILPQDVCFSAKVNQMSPEKSTFNIKCSSNSQLLSPTDCPQQENQNSPVENEPLENFLSPELFSVSTSPSKNSLLFGATSPKMEFKNSSEKELLLKVSNPSLGLSESLENQTSSAVNSPQSKLKNSPLKNQHILNINSPEKEQQKSQLNCESIPHINSPLKNSPENCQPLSEDNSSLLQYKNSPLKNQLVSKISSLEKEQQNSLLNCVSVSCMNSPPLKNSPENSQPLSEDNSSLLRYKNSPLKNQLVSKISSLEEEQQNSLLNCVSVSCMNSPPLKNSPENSQPLSEDNSSLLKYKNSPLKNQLVSKISSVEQEQKNSQSNCASLLSINSPQRKRKNKSKKCQPLSKVKRHLHQHKNTSLKIEQESNINSPDQEQQNSELNFVSSLGVNNPQLKLKNSPEKCQPLSEDNSSLLQYKNSPLKNQLVSKVSSVEQEQQNSQSNCASILNVNSPQLKRKNKPKNCQPLFKVKRHLRQGKNSSLEIEQESNVNSPDQEQQNCQLKCVSSLGVNNPQLKLKNSPEKCQPLVEDNSHLLQHKNSPLKNQLISKVNSVEQEQQNSHLNCVSVSCMNSSPLKNSPENCQPLSEDNSHLLQHENSPLKNQLISKVSSFEKEQQNSQSNCILDVNSPQLKVKNKPKNCQPLSEVSHLLQHKNSSLKIEHEFNVNSPNQEQQNSELNCVSSLDVNNPQLKLKNKLEKSQCLSEVKSHLLECKNSSFENHQLSNICSSQLELEISPSENQASSDVSSAEQNSENHTLTKSGIPKLQLENSPSKFHPTSSVNGPLELKNSPLQNKYSDSIRSPDLYLEENSLIIDEDVPQEDELQINNSDCLSIGVNKCIDSSDECSIAIPEKKPKSKKKKKQSSVNKKKKNKAPTKNEKKNLKPSAEEESVNIVISIPIVLKQIEEVKIHDSLTESHFKRYAHTLLSAIINPSNAFGTTSVLYQIFDHLRFSRTNPLVSFPIEYNISVFFPLTEKCIVSALIQAHRKKKSHLEGLIVAAINNLYLLVLSKESISKTGLGAFCRVFTELCKNVKDREKPLKLCCELIKSRHKFAPILIASIIGVWPELFAVTAETPEEEVMLHSCIAYGLEKKPSTVTSSDWKQCKAVFTKYLNSSPVADVNESTRNLIEILEEFMEENSREDEYMMTDQLLMYAACNGWKWAEENLSYFILPSLAKYAQQKDDEKAFSLFCNLYADISLLCPNFEACSEILEQLFILKEAFSYVKGCAARAMIKLYLLSKHKFPSYLYDWTQENESQLLGTPTELLLKQRLISDVSSFSENDIISP